MATITPSLNSVAGCLLGTAVGDSLGLPFERLSRRRQRRLYSTEKAIRHCFLPASHGMISDDTEHVCFTAQALAASGSDPARFQVELSRRFRWWLAALPAGVGLATLRSGLKLWLGFSPSSSGVFSAGNGPAMRAPIIGVTWKHDPHRMMELIRLSTRMTHTDPKAEWGALAVAVAAGVSSSLRHLRESGTSITDAFLSQIAELLGPNASELSELLKEATSSVNRGETTERFADSLGLHRGVTGYIYHTVPVAVHAWLSYPEDFVGGVTASIRCGGDTDTVAAVTGGILGAGCGPEGIPEVWLSGLLEWPRTCTWINRLADALTTSVVEEQPVTPPQCYWLAVVPRNALFMTVVLAHGFRRLLPPY